MHKNSLANLKPWTQGQSGNLNGRPISSRNKLTERFLADVSATWHKHGAAIIEKMAVDEPMRFADLCSRLIPRDVAVSLQARLPGNLEPDDWHLALTIFQAIRDALPGANDRPPSEVLEFVRGAIQAHGAKLIEQQ